MLICFFYGNKVRRFVVILSVSVWSLIRVHVNFGVLSLLTLNKKSNHGHWNFKVNEIKKTKPRETYKIAFFGFNLYKTE
jgi:hypothetical protein